MKISVVIPARNEEGNLEHNVLVLAEAIREQRIDFEIIVVNDNSLDKTGEICDTLAKNFEWFKAVHRRTNPGVGRAVNDGLNAIQGDAVAIMMADGSDSAQELLTCFHKLEEGYDCVFGSRWMKGGRTINYPLHKRVLNRLANNIIRIMFWIRYDDITNAFKVYRRHVVEGVRPLISCHFNVFAEMPLKAIVRGYSYAVIPISWQNRKTGAAKLKIREMSLRYIFVIIYIWLEKWLAGNDYSKRANK